MNSKQPIPEISVIIPAFNEEKGLSIFLTQLFAVLQLNCTTYEVWLIDDGSRDTTWARIREEAAKYPQLRALRFSRNFGKEAAILAGLRQAKGRAVIVMDADGQHPPTLLPQMLKTWRNGLGQIVAACKTRRNNDTYWARANACLFNRLMKWLTGLDVDGASDYRLLDRSVVNILLTFPEKVRFFRGMTAWTGFSTVLIDFEVRPRIAGESGWNNSQLIQLAVMAITSFSARPLGLVFRLGLFGMVCAGLLFLQAIYSFFSGAAVSGWTSITVVILFFGSANLIGIGVLGAYLAQIFNEVKARPEFLIQETLKQSVDNSISINNKDRQCAEVNRQKIEGEEHQGAYMVRPVLQDKDSVKE
jgi:glycosyltransferase involved in cell wall biosynthesis